MRKAPQGPIGDGMDMGVEELAAGLISLHRVQRLAGVTPAPGGAPYPADAPEPAKPPAPAMAPGDLLYRLARHQTAQARLVLQFASEQANQAFERVEARARFPTVHLDLKPTASGFAGSFTVRNETAREAVFTLVEVGRYDANGHPPAIAVKLSAVRVRLAPGAERAVTVDVSPDTAVGLPPGGCELEFDVLRDDGVGREAIKAKRVFAKFGGPGGP